MATVNPSPGALTVDRRNGADPFVTGSQDPHRQRYSAFDNSQFSLYLNGSPMQTKRALQAHLAETTRRLQETSHLGNALVQQRKELEDKLVEVENQQEDTDIGPELRQRLSELEKEFNEVGRETARSFLPKSRVPSGETDITNGASVYSSEAQHSPTKVSVPSRKQRNQQPSRINDIALATEISTSLLSQLKDLQAVLLEKDEALKACDLDRSQLEIEVEGLSQRLRTLDESESRLKDVNWNLETQVRESESQTKSAADKEHRLNYALNLARSEKSTLEREFEELKQLHSKLNDDHINRTKQHETELSSLRRNVTMGETERGAMQRKVEELTTQNQELARAVAYRMKGEDITHTEDSSPDDGGEKGDALTPEHSPPPSPSKATPRHGMLESETLKHSLQHAHRMIQQLKNNIHREKTEKVELKRMLQDARDDLEKDRTLNGPGSASKRKKNDKDVFKKPARPDRLGALRAGTHEILEDDDEWEEQDGVQSTPSRRPRSSGAVPGAFSSGFNSAAETSANEGFETANDTSDAAFETANERDGTTTETDAFQTGAETLDGNSSDELTETEGGPAQSVIRPSRSFPTRASHHDVYESTASNSGDEYDDLDLRTPIHSQQSRFRLKTRQGSSRASTPRGGLNYFASTPPVSQDSPASFISHSNGSTPAQGKSLFAELEDLSGDDEDGSYIDGTPSRSSVLHSRDSSPDMLSRKAVVLGRSPLLSPPKPPMVDSSTMTESHAPAPVTLSTVWSQHTQPQAPVPHKLNLSSFHSQGTSPQAPPKVVHQFSSFASQNTEPKSAPLPKFQISSVSGHTTTPQAAPVPSLTLSSMSAHHTAPQLASIPLSNFSALHTQDTEPRAVPAHPLNMSSVSAQYTVPQLASAPVSNFSELHTQDTPPQLASAPVSNFSVLHTQDTAPRAVPTHSLNMSSVSGHTTEPRQAATPALSVSAFASHGTEPIVPVVEKSVLPSLDVSTISHQTTEPKESHVSRSFVPAALLAGAIATQATMPHEPASTTEVSRELTSEGSSPTVHQVESKAVKTYVPLQMSSMAAHATEPKDVVRPALAISSVTSSQATAPKEVVRPTLAISAATSSQATEPKDIVRPVLTISSVTSSQATEPKDVIRPVLAFSTATYSQVTEPKEIVRPVLAFSTATSSQATEPLAPKQHISQLSELSSSATVPLVPQPSRSNISSLSSWSSAPQAPKAVPSQFSSISAQDSKPTEPSRPALPSLSVLSSQATEPVASRKPSLSAFSVTSSQATEPRQPSQRALPQISTISAQHTEPVAVAVASQPQRGFSNVHTVQHTEPVAIAAGSQSLRGFSDVRTVQHSQPESPTLPAFLPTPSSRPSTATRIRASILTLSSIVSRHTAPIIPSRPATAHRSATSAQTDLADNRQAVMPQTEKSRSPLTPISVNTATKAPKTPMADGGTQTMVSADQIDRLLLARNPRWSGVIAGTGVEKALSPPGSPIRRNSNEPGRVPRRPGSSGSVRSRAATPPPLPTDHKEVIAAAAKSLPPTNLGIMGPPSMPASAYKKRPQTPSIKSSNAVPTPKTGGTTPRAQRHSQRGDARSGASSPLSRRSSLSSFTSELDQRFNIPGGPSFAAAGLPSGATDPRMIQAITQTMCGEYLWKYTRKTGREGISENRHRRFFWLHPYTRTLYWSDRDPQTAGKTELKAKSVAIESVQEVDDGNPLPPGLHQKSLIVTTPGRSLKFTATTGQRHQTWYNALNYLCQRVDDVEQQPQQQQAQQDQRSLAADEIQDEFNASYRSSSRQTGRSMASMSSYVSRRTASPHHQQIPTLRQSPGAPQRATSTEALQSSMSNRFSSILRPTAAMRGSFSSRRSRTSLQDTVTHEEPSNSNVELGRDIHDQVGRDLDGMPNVRACCDGKHDVAHLHQHTLQGRHGKTTSSRPSLIGSMSSRAGSRANSRTESHSEARNDRIRHNTDMEAANYLAGA